MRAIYSNNSSLKKSVMILILISDGSCQALNNYVIIIAI